MYPILLSKVCTCTYCRDSNSPAFCGKLTCTHFHLISHSPAFYKNLLHYCIVMGNIGDMMQGDVNTLMVNTIKVLAPKSLPHFELWGFASLILYTHKSVYQGGTKRPNPHTICNVRATNCDSLTLFYHML